MVEVAPVTLHLKPCIYMFEMPQRRGTQSHAQVQPSGGQAGRPAGTSYVAIRFHGVLVCVSHASFEFSYYSLFKDRENNKVLHRNFR